MGREMDDNAAQAKKYRELAAQLRTVSHDVRGDDNQLLLLRVPKDYDRMASDFEAMDQHGSAIRNSN
jgi:hypothetical protein